MGYFLPQARGSWAEGRFILTILLIQSNCLLRIRIHSLFMFAPTQSTQSTNQLDNPIQQTNTFTGTLLINRAPLSVTLNTLSMPAQNSF
jgi:hypothetical protein